MKRQVIFRRPDRGTFLVLVAGLFCVSCAMAQVQVDTEIKLDVNACKASFTTTNCRGGVVNPNGDICVQHKATPIMIFRFKPPFPGAAKIKRMDIGLNFDGSCPADVASDFPAFTAGCSYMPPAPAPVLQIQNNNVKKRVWFYSLTLELPGCTGDITIHPLIENDGGL